MIEPLFVTCIECLFIIFSFAIIALAVVIIIQLNQIQGDLKTIMGTQEEFNAQIAAANAALDEIATTIAAEAEQIAEFIRNNPGVDTSALDSVVTKLQNIDEAINAVFEPPTPE